MVGYYLIMPDHIHLFCAPHSSSHTLAAWVRYWKTDFSRKHLTEDWSWQRDYWDTRIRRHEGYSEKWKYVQQNPVRKGLVENPEDWPHQGQLNSLRW